MNKNKTVSILLWVGAVACLLLAVLCGAFSFVMKEHYTKIILVIVAALFVVLGGMVAYLAYIDTFKVSASRGKKRPLNYFLNANGKRRGIAPEDLTFEIVDKQMSKFVIDTFGSPVALWKEQALSRGDDVFGEEGAFKVLVAYKMLSDLQLHHSKKAWKMFFDLPDADFADVQECLVQNGDEELARALNMYRLTGEDCVSEAAAFLDENASYIQRRMLNYVTRKIDLFNM